MGCYTEQLWQLCTLSMYSWQLGERWIGVLYNNRGLVLTDNCLRTGFYRSRRGKERGNAHSTGMHVVVSGRLLFFCSSANELTAICAPSERLHGIYCEICNRYEGTLK
jgi:hypothetical protein